MQVLYNCRLGQHLRVLLAPFGARGRDAAYTLNPLAGQVSAAWTVSGRAHAAHALRCWLA